MRHLLLTCAIAVTWLGSARDGRASAPPPPRIPEPVKGLVSKGIFLTSFRVEYFSFMKVWLIPLRGQGGEDGVTVALSNTLTPRWSVGYGGFWLCSWNRWGGNPDPRHATEAVDRYQFPDLLRGKVIKGKGATAGELSDSFSYPSAGHHARELCFEGRVEFEPFIETDLLPMAAFEVRQFVLSNVRGKVVPRGKTDVLGAYSVIVERKDRETPHWSFKVHRCKSTWDQDNVEWKQGTWSEEVTLPVMFKESFQVLGKGDDWYFITKSGKLYLSRKPAKGKKRTVELIWNRPKQRIVAFITDADKNRSFLFCKPEKSGAKPTYFELSDKPKPVAYDPPTVKVPEIKVSFLYPFWHDKESRKKLLALQPDHVQNAKRQEAAVRRDFALVYLCGRVLVADKKITLPKAKKK